ncbi:hypothetical protein B9Z55_011023 [Caenorhabditis nigoni]|uniref:histone acetyltransferase n=1 Tax=Caenorhabditis nigoni TaxID=1611254 RepID=A0A2G5UIA7_9PELO|nr:hypothetical protein B9Z55_011023 [Caenorhabditis nigoni]
MGLKRVLRVWRDPKNYVKTEDLVPPSWKQKFIAKYGKVIEFASRAIQVFQQQDDVDQIFSRFASEYRNPIGDGTSWMVIDCLDGVKLFQPASLRTQIYRTLISSYFDLARSMGLLDQKLCKILWSPLMSGYDVVGKPQKLGRTAGNSTIREEPDSHRLV